MWLVVLVNGLHGNASEFDSLAHHLSNTETISSSSLQSSSIPSQSSSSIPSQLVVVMQSKANAYLQTCDGLERMGERLAQEVREYVRQTVLPRMAASDDRVLLLSVLGHSLGGLILREALPQLLCHAKRDDTRRVDTSVDTTVDTTVDTSVDTSVDTLDGMLAQEGVELRTVSYVSVNTPHLGSRRPPSLVGTLVDRCCRRLIGRTGKELVLADHPSSAECALARLCRSSEHVAALDRFPRKTLAASMNDLTVPLCSATLLTHTAPFYQRNNNNNDVDDINVLLDTDTSTLSKNECSPAESTASTTSLATIDGTSSYSSPSELFQVDDANKCEYLCSMHDDLACLSFRQLVYDMNVSAMFHVAVHALSIGRRIPLLPASVQQQGEKAAVFLSNLLKKDLNDIAS